ncbi:YceD family protein [Nocardioides sp. LMS-CY]|uniref:YceD family protein n=1 Tax=Nocardioides sp. (strain LMS-CY) TaxID=2840457 RepID=UPI00207978DF|nr:YceD family protein [Nocardioides sp. LMS-CY]
MPETGSRTLSSLDPRAPLVLDTRELGRRPGSQHQVTRTVPAPADLGIEVLRVPEGSQVELDLRLEAVMEGVLVTGSTEVEPVGECARCLEPISDRMVVGFQELFVYEDQRNPSEEDDEVSTLEGDLVDLEPLLRDAVVLALPFQPLCEDDCPGLCPDCGARLKDDPDHAHDAPIDPRWAGLAALKQDQHDQN